MITIIINPSFNADIKKMHGETKLSGNDLLGAIFVQTLVNALLVH